MSHARWLAALAALAAGCSGVPRRQLTEEERRDGWQLLFDGATLDGWKVTGNPESWKVQGGAIACHAKKGGYLHTLEEYDDFALSLEYKVAKGTNSGVFFRWSNLKDPVHTGIEIQVLDSHGRATPGTHDDGAIYDLVAPSKNMSRPAGEWNRLVITAVDNRVEVAHNGEKVAEMDLNLYTEAGKNPDGSKNKFKYAFKELPRRGYIGFQDHGGGAWFREIKLKPLPRAQ